MNQEPDIDVVMPVKDGEMFLGAAIASIMSQSYERLRLIVVDDNSVDASRAIAERYARQGSLGIHVVRSEGSGIVAALNTGIAAGSAPLIARMDADDVALPRRLEQQAAFLGEHPAVALAGGFANVIDGLGRTFRQLTYPTLPQEIESRILTEVCFAHPTMLLRRAAVEDVGGFHPLFEWAEDVDLALRLSERHPLANLATVVVSYRVHARNISAAKLKRQTQAVIVARAAARSRRTTGASPSANSLDELQRLLGVSQTHVDEHAFNAALTWGSLLAETGLTDECNEVLRIAATLGDGILAHEEIEARIADVRRLEASAEAQGAAGTRGRKRRRSVASAWRVAGSRVRSTIHINERSAAALQLAHGGVQVLRRRGLRTFAKDVRVWNVERRLNELAQGCTAPPTRRRRPLSGVPLVSVIVRTRDRPDDLRQALNSLAWQKLDAFEVVVVNDGGRDVAHLIAPYESAMSIRYVRNVQGHGRSQAVNDGVDAATGSFVSFLDDDDIVYPFHLASLLRLASRPGDPMPMPFVYSHYNRVLVSGRGEAGTIVERAHPPVWTFNRAELFVQNRPPLHTWLLARKLFNAHGGFDPSLAILHDWDFLLRVTETTALVGLARETCEYRFYLDAANSVADRTVVLDEVREIYRRFPTSTHEMIAAREETIAAVESHAALADELRSGVELGAISQDEAAHRYVAETFGFSRAHRAA